MWRTNTSWRPIIMFARRKGYKKTFATEITEDTEDTEITGGLFNFSGNN